MACLLACQRVVLRVVQAVLLLGCRYWIILTERILRQWVATPALGRGHNFVAWLRDTAAANQGAGTAVKLAM